MRLSSRKSGTKTLCILALTMACFFLFTHSTAFAQSPIHGVAEVKLGGYYPAIDEAYDGTGPYETFFGKEWNYHGEIEWDFYLLQNVLKVGKLGIGIHLGYSSATGSVQVATDTTETDDVPGETNLTTIPIRASLLYRYDYSAIHHGIPLVPVVKLGLDYIFWDITDSNDDTAVYEGTVASGGKWGYHAALGMHFLLDVIDESSAAYFDMSWGVNNSYIFAEYMLVRANDFGKDGFDLSDNMWMFGLAFEF